MKKEEMTCRRCNLNFKKNKKYSRQYCPMCGKKDLVFEFNFDMYNKKSKKTIKTNKTNPTNV